MMCSRKAGAGQQLLSEYASVGDFCRLFAEHVDDLYQLSFLLTADHQKAQECFVSGLEESAKENHVFKEWARSWAKRAIIQNAIRRCKPRLQNLSFSLALPLHVVALPSDQDRHFAVDAVLALKDFERFVFVMSVLEHYSEHECSLLLGCSPREIRETQARTFDQLLNTRLATVPGTIAPERTHELVR